MENHERKTGQPVPTHYKIRFQFWSDQPPEKEQVCVYPHHRCIMHHPEMLCGGCHGISHGQQRIRVSVTGNVRQPCKRRSHPSGITILSAKRGL